MGWTPFYTLGFITRPMKSRVPVSVSRMAKMNGRSMRTSSGSVSSGAAPPTTTRPCRRRLGAVLVHADEGFVQHVADEERFRRGPVHHAGEVGPRRIEGVGHSQRLQRLCEARAELELEPGQVDPDLGGGEPADRRVERAGVQPLLECRELALRPAG